MEESNLRPHSFQTETTANCAKNACERHEWNQVMSSRCAQRERGRIARQRARKSWLFLLNFNFSRA